jgi:hypothetical protein
MFFILSRVISSKTTPQENFFAAGNTKPVRVTTLPQTSSKGRYREVQGELPLLIENNIVGSTGFNC